MSNGKSKLPVIATLSAVVQRISKNVTSYGLLALPTFFFSLLSYYVQISHVNYSIESGDYSRTRFDLVTFASQIVGIVLYVMLFANIVRRTLLGSVGPRNIFGLGWGWREFRIVGRYLLVLIVLLLLLAPVIVLVISMTGDKEKSLWLAFIPLATLALVVFVSCRTLTYVTAPSLDTRMSFGDAFDSTKGNVLRIFASFLLLMLPYLIAWAIFVAIVGSPIEVALLVTNSFLVVIVLNFVSVTMTVFSMVLVALIYEHLVPAPTTGQELPGSETSWIPVSPARLP